MCRINGAKYDRQLDNRRERHGARQALKTGRPSKLIKPHRWARRPKQPVVGDD